MVYVAIAAIAVGVLMLGAVALQLRRGRTPPKRILDLPEEEQALLTDSSSRPPTFRVIALGLSGAGKTLLLSSMYHALNFPSNARPYHLETGAADATLLANIRDQVLDRDAGWPSATPLVDERDFRFDYVARDASGQKHTILRMEYLDYAGEILTPGDQEGIANLEKLEERIQGAHALLGLIDGIKLRKFKQGDPEGLRYFDAVLLPMIGFMQQASCPIQLVVTKWDLVPDLDRPGPVERDQGVEAGQRGADVRPADQSARGRSWVEEDPLHSGQRRRLALRPTGGRRRHSGEAARRRTGARQRRHPPVRGDRRPPPAGRRIARQAAAAQDHLVCAQKPVARCAVAGGGIAAEPGGSGAARRRRCAGLS